MELGLSLIAMMSSLCSASIIHVDLERGCDATGDGSFASPFRTLQGWTDAAAESTGASGITFGPGVHSVVPGSLVLDTPGTAMAPFVVRGAGMGLTQLTGGTMVHGFQV